MFARLRSHVRCTLAGECLNALQLATWSVNGLAHCAAAVLVPLLAFGAGDDVVRFVQIRANLRQIRF